MCTKPGLRMWAPITNRPQMLDIYPDRPAQQQFDSACQRAKINFGWRVQ